MWELACLLPQLDCGVLQVVFQSSTCLGGGKVKPDTDLRN
ncbi:hypothetical protein SAMN04490190_4412 [Pseudomonas libanensis]|nr:hypothetical protein SAMN04490190_4412 [Pseudomonas libanensis]